MGDALFHDTFSNYVLSSDVVSVFCLDDPQFALEIGKSFRVYWGLLLLAIYTSKTSNYFTWGTKPLGSGMSMIPAMKLVQPRRKKSQWNPPGFRSGNCFACAATLL